MKATEKLMAEHRDMKLMLQVLEKVSDQLDETGEIVFDHMDKILEFLDLFIDKTHNIKEESILFPAMIEAGVPRQGLIGVMLKEHREEHAYLKKLHEVYDAYKKGSESFLEEIVKNADAYRELVLHHIHQEDYVLYPLADTHVSEGKHALMQEQFRNLEIKNMGKGKHQEYHQWIYFLSEIYLKEEIVNEEDDVPTASL